jgi:dual-specificity kinase
MLGCLRQWCATKQTHENLEHLAMMEAVLGPIPEHMARHANRGSAKYFTHRNRLNWPAGAASRKSVRAVAKMRDLRDIMVSGCDASVKPHTDVLVRCRLMEGVDRQTRC